jgi:hemoglobin
MLTEVIDRESVGKLVRSFYRKIIDDEVVGPYFIRALGANQKNDKWYEHFVTLDRFWLMVMTGEEGYRGSPFVPHAMLPDLTKEKFERWLELFSETLNEVYVEEVATKFHAKAAFLAQQFLELLADEDEEE